MNRHILLIFLVLCQFVQVCFIIVSANSRFPVDGFVVFVCTCWHK